MSMTRDIKGFPGYRIASNRKVWSKKSGGWKELKQVDDGRGYYMVDLCAGGGKVTKRVHRLMAEAFIPNPGNKPYVCHKDDNGKDNRIENLYWGTVKDNVADAIRNGKHPSLWQRGELGPNARLTEQHIEVIRWAYKKGIKQWQLGKMFNVGQDHISRIVNFKRWVHI